MEYLTSYWFIVAANGLVLVPALIGTWRLKKLTTTMKGVLLVLWVSFFVNAIALYQSSQALPNTLILSVDATLISTTFIWAFARALRTHKWVSTVLYIGMVSNIVLAILPHLSSNLSAAQLLYIQLANSLLIVLAALSYYLLFPRLYVVIQVFQSSLIYIAIGLVVLHIGTLVTNNYWHLVLNEAAGAIWHVSFIEATMKTMYHLLVAIGMYKAQLAVPLLRVNEQQLNINPEQLKPL